MPLAHDAVYAAFTTLKEHVPEEGRIAGLAKWIESSAIRHSDTRLGQATIRTADRLLTAADGTIDYAASTRLGQLALSLVQDTIAPAALSTAQKASATTALITTKCASARDTTTRSVGSAVASARAAPKRVSVYVLSLVHKGNQAVFRIAVRVVGSGRKARDAVIVAAHTTRAKIDGAFEAASSLVRSFIESILSNLNAAGAKVWSVFRGRYKGSYTLVRSKSAQFKSMITPLKEFWKTRVRLTPAFFLGGISNSQVGSGAASAMLPEARPQKVEAVIVEELAPVAVAPAPSSHVAVLEDHAAAESRPHKGNKKKARKLKAQQQAQKAAISAIKTAKTMPNDAHRAAAEPRTALGIRNC